MGQFRAQASTTLKAWQFLQLASCTWPIQGTTAFVSSQGWGLCLRLLGATCTLTSITRPKEQLGRSISGCLLMALEQMHCLTFPGASHLLQLGCFSSSIRTTTKSVQLTHPCHAFRQVRRVPSMRRAPRVRASVVRVAAQRRYNWAAASARSKRGRASLTLLVKCAQPALIAQQTCVWGGAAAPRPRS